MDNLPVVLIGMGGHARVLLEAMCCSSITVKGYVSPEPVGVPEGPIPYLGNDDYLLANLSPEEIRLVNGVGSVNSAIRRKDVFDLYKRFGYQFITVIHPSSIVARDVILGEGSQIMAGVVIQPGVSCGDNVIINTRAGVDHDCVLGAHSHISVGVTLSGAVLVGEGAHLGAGCTVIQNIEIGSNSIVGAGAVVIRDVLMDDIVAGVPSRGLKK